jgi:hypothetical protein
MSSHLIYSVKPSHVIQGINSSHVSNRMRLFESWNEDYGILWANANVQILHLLFIFRAEVYRSWCDWQDFNKTHLFLNKRSSFSLRWKTLLAISEIGTSVLLFSLDDVIVVIKWSLAIDDLHTFGQDSVFLFSSCYLMSFHCCKIYQKLFKIV